MDNLFSQPWQIQLALASGYAAYCLAYMGIRHHHRAIEMTFKVLLFSLITVASLALLPSHRPIASGLTAFVATCVSALVWRKWARELVGGSLKRWGITWSDDDPSALASLCANRDYPVSQIAIELEDGSWLECRDAEGFAAKPFGAFLIGPEGDVALYLTHETEPGKNEREVGSVNDAHWGDRITYVSASRIRRISLRHRRPG